MFTGGSRVYRRHSVYFPPVTVSITMLLQRDRYFINVTCVQRFAYKQHSEKGVHKALVCRTCFRFWLTMTNFQTQTQQKDTTDWSCHKSYLIRKTNPEPSDSAAKSGHSTSHIGKFSGASRELGKIANVYGGFYIPSPIRTYSSPFSPLNPLCGVVTSSFYRAFILFKGT